jgi:hypothetical protein
MLPSVMPNKKGKPYSNMNELYWLASIDILKVEVQSLIYRFDYITYIFKLLSKMYLMYLNNAAFNYAKQKGQAL